VAAAATETGPTAGTARSATPDRPHGHTPPTDTVTTDDTEPEPSDLVTTLALDPHPKVAVLMLVFLSNPLRRWTALSIVVPLLAAAMTWISRALQRRSGHPTLTSKTLLAMSTFIDKRRHRSDVFDHAAVTAPTEPTTTAASTATR
jgi:hypothetical protein